MNDGDLETIFQLMGQKIRPGGRGHNRSVSCPLSQWTHTKGKDKNPSMTVKAGEPALGKCWTCGTQGTVKKIARIYGEHSGDNRAYEFACSIETGNRWNSVKQKFNQKIKESVKKKFSKEIYDSTDERFKRWMNKVPKYAFDRGITKEQIIKWDIGLDEKAKRMIITIKDFSGRIVGFSGRDLTGKQKPKYKHFSGFKKEMVLFGEAFLDRKQRRAYIVEGFFDVWSLERKGLKNVLAVMGTSISDEQVRKLCRWFKEVVFIPDCDDAGYGLKFAEIYAPILLKSEIPLKVGIAGVRKNKGYIDRDKPKNKWESCDFRFKPIQEMMGKDPDNLGLSELDIVLKNIEWVTLGGLRGEDCIFS